MTHSIVKIMIIILLIRDVVGIVATLGKVDDPNLSRWVGFFLVFLLFHLYNAGP